MGYCKPRRRKHGTRYTAIYLDADGIERSAGTFDSSKEANDAWIAAEAKVKEGRGYHLVNGRKLFREYVEEDWLPNRVAEASTKQNETYCLYAHIMAAFENKRMLDIHPIDIKRWLTDLKEAGLSAANRKVQKAILSTILGSAVDDQILVWNPCKVVKTDPVPEQPIEIVNPAEFDRFYNTLPDPMSKLLVEVAIETGMRWGELTELRPKDFDQTNCVITVTRAVVSLTPEFHPEGQRYLVKDYPKGRNFRRIKIGPEVASRLTEHINAHQIGDDQLLFWYTPTPRAPRSTLRAVPTEALGRTAPNAKGLTYAHGTKTAYTSGRCRCRYCRAAMADYRRQRRGEGKDTPRPARIWDTDGHLPHQWFRNTIIKPALAEASIKTDIKMHRLRHAHASWLINGGADLVVVKKRLGHSSILTTERYLHTLENADDTALAALNRVRAPRNATPTAPANPPTSTNPLDLNSLNEAALLALIGSAQTELTHRILKDGGPQ